ncbi:hypothetical protein H0H92_010272, partial [Tricholoma furcatifolium]
MSLYEVVPRGMPMNPEELRQLVLFMRGHARNTSPYYRVMAQRMLMELDHIICAVPPDMWDCTMQASQAFPGLREDLRERILPHNKAWTWVSWDLNPQARIGNPSNLNQGVGLQPVPALRGLDIEEWCRYILHHGYPGSPNQFTGVAMDFALRVERRSAFGYALGRALCPTKARSQFMRHFAMVLARPEVYREFICEYEARFPQHPFVPQGIAAPTVSLRRLIATSSQVANLSAADILHLLFVNRIPPTWVDHAYTFGVVYLSYHFTASALTRETMLETVEGCTMRKPCGS